MFYISWLSSLGNFLDITLMNISSIFGSYFTYLLLNQTWAHTLTCSKAKLLTPSWSGSEACFPPTPLLGALPQTLTLIQNLLWEFGSLHYRHRNLCLVTLITTFKTVNSKPYAKHVYFKMWLIINCVYISTEKLKISSFSLIAFVK